MADYDFDAAAKTKILKIDGNQYTVSEPCADLILKHLKHAKDMPDDAEAVICELIRAIREAIPDLTEKQLKKKPLSVLRRMVMTIYSDWEEVGEKNA